MRTGDRQQVNHPGIDGQQWFAQVWVAFRQFPDTRRLKAGVIYKYWAFYLTGRDQCMSKWLGRILSGEIKEGGLFQLAERIQPVQTELEWDLLVGSGMSVPVQDYGCLLRKAIAVQCRAMRMLGVMWPADSLTPSWRSRARLYAWESSSGVGTARICSELWFMVWSCNFIL